MTTRRLSKVPGTFPYENLFRGWILVFTLLGFLAPSCAKQEAETLENFLKKRIQAINQDDQAAYLKTFHPKILARMNDTNREVFEQLFQKDLAKQIPENYQLEIQEVRAQDPLFFEETMEYVTRPSHLLTVDYQQDLNTYAQILWYAIQEKGEWFIIIPVPSEEMMQAMKAGSERSPEAEKKIQKVEQESLAIAGDKLEEVLLGQ